MHYILFDLTEKRNLHSSYEKESTGQGGGSENVDSIDFTEGESVELSLDLK